MSDLRRAALRSFHVPVLTRASEVARSLSSTGRVLFYIFAALIVFSGGGLLFLLNTHYSVEVPARGGSFTEGDIGTPRFINPVLAISDADNDLTALVYSGLLKTRPDGTYVPDLAQSYEVSDDGRTYTVHLRPDAKFQDGTPVTADDVVFTVNKALDPAIKSPQRADWDGVSVTATDSETVQFTLPSPYAPFVENLTLGILPKALWENVSAEEFPFSDLNTMPVGSGPYQVAGVDRNSSGIPSAYHLRAFSKYALGQPYLTDFTVKFYQNESGLVSALKSGAVEAGSGISPAALGELKGFNIETAPENRVFGVFFNQNQNQVLQNTAVRKALNDAIDRTALVQTVLGGYGTPASGPIPPGILPAASSTVSGTGTAESASSTVELARQELLDAGWKPDGNGVLAKTTGSGKNAQTLELSFTLSTGNVPELTAAAEFLRQQWTALGAKVDVQVFNQGDLSQNVIRPRKYDALLFGEIIGRALDLFAFWHSSQRNDPGLNIALYANSSVDKILSDLRQTQDESARQSLYQQFESEIAKDAPAVFLYSPDFVYVFPQGVHGMTLGSVEQPSDRFDTASSWYRETDRVWKIFAPLEVRS